MDKREWLRSKGFDVGNRGRFSAEMLEALKEYDNGSTDGAPVASLQQVLKKFVMRDATAYVAVTNQGTTVACGYCAICHESVMYCACIDGPHAPDWLTDDLAEWYPVYSR
jgi:hypothetical protein